MDCPEYLVLDPIPDQSNIEPWDFNIFPNTGIESYDNQMVELGEALQLPSIPHTCNNIELDTEFEFCNVEVTYKVDSKGVTVPMATAYAMVKSVNVVKCNRFLKCLFDTGGSVSMAHRSVLPPGAELRQSSQSTICNTIAGNYMPVGSLLAENIKLPEFDANLTVDSQEFLVLDPKCSFDLILGNDFLMKIGLFIDYETLELEWRGKRIPMNSKFTKERLSAAIGCCIVEEEDEELDYLDSFATVIADSTYEELKVDKVIAENCQHLSMTQRQDLAEMFRKHYKLFDGKLHVYKGAKMDIELQPGV